MRIGSRFAKSQYQYTLQGTDIASLYENAARLEARLKTEPSLENVTSDLQIKNPEVRVDIDRDRAAALGVTPEQIQQALYYAYGSRQVSTIFTPNNQYSVIMELAPRFQSDLVALRLLSVRSSTGQPVPIGSLARLSTGLGALTVNHAGHVPAVTLSSDIATNFAGTAQAFQSSQQGLALLLLIAVLLIYLVLGVLYESFIHPLTILSGLPFAGFGALLTLFLFRTELSVYAFVGVILLVGLVKKNAIMMIDFALDAERTEGKEPREAIMQACSIRFRPIMMTTMAALVGTLPIALGWGAGAESRRPLGLAVVGGLAFSQVITLYVTPVFCTYLDEFQRRVRRKPVAPRHAARGEAGEVAKPAGAVTRGGEGVPRATA